MAPKNDERSATMPTIIAIVECAGSSDWFECMPAQLHAFDTDLTQNP